jgi:hypothetical protein
MDSLILEGLIQDQIERNQRFGSVGLEDCSVYPIRLSKKVIKKARKSEAHRIEAIICLVNDLLEEADYVIQEIKERK